MENAMNSKNEANTPIDENSAPDRLKQWIEPQFGCMALEDALGRGPADTDGNGQSGS
jgi:hypothetical protein